MLQVIINTKRNILLQSSMFFKKTKLHFLKCIKDIIKAYFANVICCFRLRL